jgi:hypothetical protein
VARSLAVIALVSCFPVAWCAGAEMPHGHTSWVRLATPGLEVYTTADEDAGRSLILRLERLRSVLQPILGWDQLEKPICIIEFGSREEFLPFAPMSRSIGYFLPGARRDFVVLDGTHAEGRAAGHEYVHFVMAQNGLRLPTWLNEGLAELYSNLEGTQSGQRTTIGQFIPGRVVSLRHNAWIGLTELTSATAGSQIFMGAGSVDSAYSESWLLAHMLVLDPRYEAKFPDLLAALQTLQTAAAFRQVYDKSIAEVERDLKAYLETGQTNARNVGDSPAPAAMLVTVEREADFEGLSALAEMLGHYRGHTEQSRDLYRQLERDYPQRLP